MVKAVHSPFKSVLKLGLLETYADTSASRLTLCDRIKHNLFLRRRGVQRADPYGALFATLHNYYAKRGDKEAARLLTESFMFKANLQDIPFFLNLPARFEDASLIAALFGKGYTDPEKVKAKKDNRASTPRSRWEQRSANTWSTPTNAFRTASKNKMVRERSSMQKT